jgi:hypothetical protein
MEWKPYRDPETKAIIYGEDVFYIRRIQDLGYKVIIAGSQLYKHLHKDIHLVIVDDEYKVEPNVYNAFGHIAIKFEDIRKISDEDWKEAHDKLVNEMINRIKEIKRGRAEDLPKRMFGGKL